MICVVDKDPLAPVASRSDVVHRTRELHPDRSGHAPKHPSVDADLRGPLPCVEPMPLFLLGMEPHA
jgi:hypothetical protein